METLIPTLMFYVFASLTVGSALGVVCAKNSVHSVFFLIFAFFNAAGLFVLIGAEFIAMILVIVYVGAVAVLFLFVVMMLNVNFAELRAGFVEHLPLGATIAGGILFELILVIWWSLNGSEVLMPVRNLTPNPEQITNTEAIGHLLYTDYIYAFQICGLILLVAMIGAIVLTLRHRPDVRRQNIEHQITRRREDSIEIVQVQTGQGA